MVGLHFSFVFYVYVNLISLFYSFSLAFLFADARVCLNVEAKKFDTNMKKKCLATQASILYECIYIYSLLFALSFFVRCVTHNCNNIVNNNCKANASECA